MPQVDASSGPPSRTPPRDWAAFGRVAGACRAVGLDPSGARHIRSRSCEVWVVPDPGVVVRISNAQPLHRVRATMRLVSWMVAGDLPVAAPWPGFPDAVVLGDGRTATYWRTLKESPERRNYRAFGALLRDIHGAVPPGALRPDDLDPAALASRVLDGRWPDCGVPRSFAVDRIHALAEQSRPLITALPTRLVHGDAHIGNVLLDGDRMVLGDWDDVVMGIPEWDLIPTATEPQRWSRPIDDYRAFVAGYGYDATTWEHFGLIRELFEWGRIGIRMRMAVQQPDVGRHLCRHIRTMFTGDVGAWWHEDDRGHRSSFRRSSGHA